ncbi:selenide, water dikinase SelD [Congregibacter variabilis]|uniref:Selenide, water dikinase SelD n=1 Tax=Congregibacter variabilis TaxID=3081200 RepID=A0ABZ0I1P5_9GAMM|nr:selenide, water dikinase SelD [Congregibacter sp. IMCC43200]
MLAREPAQQDLVLVGGGHSHVLVLRQLAMARPSGLRITLISPAVFTPYSGMLPGLLAGHYGFEETHIDLRRLCQWAGVRFLVDTVESLDPRARRLHCRARKQVGYDVLSIDIGSEPELDSVPGAREFSIPVKPVAGLWNRWESLARDDDLASRRIAIVGGGAGSVEIALAVAHRLGEQKPAIALYCGGQQILAGYTRGVQRAVERQLETLGVSLLCGHRVSEVTSTRLQFDSADAAHYDTLIWCTGAAAAPWIKQSGLPVDERGFMRIEDSLQSTEFPNVFGAGDIATQYRHPRPKAGVYAVRQGPVLADNLGSFVTGAPLRNHKPQTGFLSMLALGPKLAVAQRNGLSVRGAWVWRWKDRIDREFMQRFSNLPTLEMGGSEKTQNSRDPSPQQAPCGGCGAKVSGDALHAVLGELRELYPELMPEAGALDDAAPLETTLSVVQSLDAIRGLVDDPWRMGRIAAQHALSDLYASGAQPHSALALVTLPFAAPSLLHRDLRFVLEGALSVFEESGCRLNGGHSMQGPELQLGFAVNGVLQVGCSALHKRGAGAGDQLLISKKLGSGAICAAHMQGLIDGRHVEDALMSMEQSNAIAAAVARDFNATAVTDITGFGLAGHLLEMLDETLCAELCLDQLPVMPGALQAMAEGVFSTLHEPNRQALAERWLLPAQSPLQAQLLFDPQTSGGLLMAFPGTQAQAARRALQDRGVESTIIGTVKEAVSGAATPVLSFS